MAASKKIIRPSDFKLPDNVIEAMRKSMPQLLHVLGLHFESVLNHTRDMSIPLDEMSDAELRVHVQVRKEKVDALKIVIKQIMASDTTTQSQTQLQLQPLQQTENTTIKDYSNVN